MFFIGLIFNYLIKFNKYFFTNVVLYHVKCNEKWHIDIPAQVIAKYNNVNEYMLIKGIIVNKAVKIMNLTCNQLNLNFLCFTFL